MTSGQARRSTPVVRTPFVRVLFTYVRARGADADQLAAAFGIDLAQLGRAATSPEEEPEYAIATLKKLADAAAHQLGDPFLGINLAAGAERGSYGVVDFVAASAPTVREALHRLIRYQRLVNTAVTFSIEEKDGRAILEHRLLGATSALGRHGNEYTVATLVRRFRDLSRTTFVPQCAWFAHARPADVSAIIAALGTDDLRFDAGCNGFSFPQPFLEAPIPSADGALLRVLDGYAARLVPATPPADDVRARVEHQVRLRLPSGRIDIQSVSSTIAMSARSLQRRLEEIGTSYQEVVDDVRRTQALKHIADPKLSVSEVAFLVGYSEPRAFLRAFKRWTGTSPQRHRRQQRVGDSTS